MFNKENFFLKKIQNLIHRLEIRLENNNNSNFSTNGEEVFINNLLAYFQKSNNKKIMLDVGANVGEYSEMLIENANKFNLLIDLHIFEPQKSCYATLLRKFSDENFHLNNFGLSNEESNVKIFYDKESSRLASIYQRNLSSADIKLDKFELINLKTLSSYIKDKNIEHIDFMKIDIEGNELNAFRGVGKYFNEEFIDFIQFEYGGANLDSHTSLMDIYEFLDEKGFKVAKIMRKGLNIRQYTPSMDNFQYSNYIAVSNKIYNKLKND